MSSHCSKIKSLFISSWYPNRLHPTLGIFIRRHAEAVSLYCDVAALYVCADAGINGKCCEITEQYEKNIFTVHVYYPKTNLRIPLFSLFIKMYRYLNAHKKGIQTIQKKFGTPDIVHLNIIFPAGIIALLIKYIHNIPYIITENWTGYLPSDGRYKGFFRKIITKTIAVQASFITPVSLDLEHFMKKHGFCNHYKIIPNVVNTKVFYPEKHKLSRNRIQAIHVSTLDAQQKNVSGILRAVKKISEKRNDFELLVAGEGEHRNSLENYAAELGILNKTVFFTGLKLENELAVLMRQSDFFILFSNYENLPCVVLEALASGIPVIVTRIGGTPEHISEALGIVISPQDETALEKAVEYMLDNYSKYDSTVIRKYADASFSFEKIGKQFEEIYIKVKEKNRTDNTTTFHL